MTTKEQQLTTNISEEFKIGYELGRQEARKEIIEDEIKFLEMLDRYDAEGKGDEEIMPNILDRIKIKKNELKQLGDK